MLQTNTLYIQSQDSSDWHQWKQMYLFFMQGVHLPQIKTRDPRTSIQLCVSSAMELQLGYSGLCQPQKAPMILAHICMLALAYLVGGKGAHAPHGSKVETVISAVLGANFYLIYFIIQHPVRTCSTTVAWNPAYTSTG